MLFTYGMELRIVYHSTVCQLDFIGAPNSEI